MGFSGRALGALAAGPTDEAHSLAADLTGLGPVVVPALNNPFPISLASRSRSLRLCSPRPAPHTLMPRRVNCDLLAHGDEHAHHRADPTSAPGAPVENTFAGPGRLANGTARRRLGEKCDLTQCPAFASCAVALRF
jgi:hypothetical protein